MTFRLPLLVCGLLLWPVVAAAQDAPERPARPERTDGPWFGVTLPAWPGAEPAVLVGDRRTRPVAPAPGEPSARELSGEALRADLETIVGFSKESRETREIGQGQLWGRVSGLPSATKTIRWAADQLRKAGVADVTIQPIAQEPRASLWLPLSWEVRLLADPAFGSGSADVVLQSAIPVSPTEIPGGTLTASLVFVGTGGRAVLDAIDVKGKIAIQLSIPQGHMLFERGPVTTQARDLFARGAVAVFNLVRLPGNELGRDFSNCGGPCFNIGGRDGHFLETVVARATRAGAADRLRARLTLETETRSGLNSENAVAVVPGRNTNEVILIDAHADAWFDGAGDNADGLAVMLGLARHFAQPANTPARTLVFIVSGGHHTPGINGPRAFVAANPELASKAVMVINVEHVAQRNFSPARSVGQDGYRQAVADTGEAPVYAGISNRSALLDDLVQQGVTRFGVNFVSERSDMESGETGGFAAVKTARVTIMQAPPLYHTTGEVLDVISTPGLERMARFLAYFIREAAAAPRTAINP
jgi:hypothetical protein